MDFCLLCLELREEFDVVIDVQSQQWRNENIEELIEKHFWSLDSMSTREWICLPCWHNVSEFHKFYLRVESAHKQLNFKNKQVPTNAVECADSSGCIGEVTADLEESDCPHNKAADNSVTLAESSDCFNVDINECSNAADSTNDLDAEQAEECFDDQPSEISNVEHSKSSNDLSLPCSPKAAEVPVMYECEIKPLKRLLRGKSYVLRLGNKAKKGGSITIDSRGTSGGKLSISEKVNPNSIVEELNNDNNNNTTSQEPKENGLIETNLANDFAQNSTEYIVNKDQYDLPCENDVDTLQIQDDVNQEECSNSSKDSFRKSRNDLPLNKENDEPAFLKNDYDQDKCFNTPAKTSARPTSSRKRKTPHDDFVAQHYKIYCGICNRDMKSFLELSQHSSEEHEEKGYVICCGKKFYQRFSYVDHLIWHADPEYFKCHKCGKTMANGRCLREHILNHSNRVKHYICDECGKAFSYPLALERHKGTHASIEDKQLACDECGKHFYESNALKLHVQTYHVKKYHKICEVCGASILTRYAFECHMRQHAGLPALRVSCDKCGLKLSKRSLAVHMELKHPEGGPKIYKCELCPKISPNERALKKHIKDIHDPNFKYTCTICGKAFKRAVTFKDHVATHTGIANYTCNYCHKNFKAYASLQMHRRNLHTKEWQEEQRDRYSGKMPPNNFVTQDDGDNDSKSDE